MKEEAIKTGAFYPKLLVRENQTAEIAQLVDLRNQLIVTGYNASEVDYLISSVAGTANFQHMDAATREKVQQFMHNQLAIARGCLQLIKNGSHRA
ncbi:MAG: hypothetical protein ACOY81_07010 [Bacillota bacterium]